MRPFRKERVANSIREIVSGVIDHKLQDPRLNVLTTVTRVVMSGDLMYATVYLTVQGDSAAERRTLAAIQHAAGFIQRAVARELTMRHCPELRFRIDESVKGVLRTMAILEENRRTHPELFEPECDAHAEPPADGSGKEADRTDAVQRSELDE